MHTWLLVLTLSATAAAQTGGIGAFTHSGDVGSPAIQGAAAFDAAAGQYRITGAGANIWAKQDQFQYVWRAMTGNLAVAATLRFLGEGAAHRKAGIMLRQTLDADSPYIDLMVHGDGMPAVQWRNAKSEITNTFDFPSAGPGQFQLKLVREGTKVSAWLARDGADLKELGHTQIQLGAPVLVGLAVCSHRADASDTAMFSDVSVKQLVPPVAGKK